MIFVGPGITLFGCPVDAGLGEILVFSNIFDFPGLNRAPNGAKL